MILDVKIRGINCRIARITSKTKWVFIEVECSDGIKGIGEASANGLETVLNAYTSFMADRLKGLPALPNSVEHILCDTRGGLPQRAVASAIEQALWDAQGQRLDLPATDILGGAIRETIPLYANINRGTENRSPEGFAATARRAVEAGFQILKIAPFDGLGEGDPNADPKLFRAGLECIISTCEAVRDEAEVMVDCHWRLDEPRASELLTFAAERNLYWVECPIPETLAHLPEMRRLRQRATDLGVRLAGMEKGIRPFDFQPYIVEGLYDVLMPDVKYTGGLSAMGHVAEAAAPAGILIAPHNPTGPICHAASVVVSAIMPNLLFLEIQFGESELFQDLVAGELVFNNSEAMVSPKPGLGVKLIPEVMSEIEISC